MTRRLLGPKLARVAGALRWSYLAPRLGLLLGLLLASEYGAGWLVKSAIQSAGARIEIARSEASLLGGRVELSGVAVADPSDASRNLFQADAILLDIDTASLLRKRAEVTRGVVRGLRLGGARVTTGAPTDEPPHAVRDAPSKPRWLRDAAAGGAEQWLTSVGDRLSADLTGELESPALARELEQRWPRRYAELAESVEAVRAEYRRLAAEAEQAQENPLRHAAFFRALPARIAAAKDRLTELAAEADALPNELAADRRAVADARDRDARRLHERLTAGRLDADSLTRYLIGDELAAPLGRMVDCLRWARAFAPAGVGRPATQRRSRGVDIVPPGVRRRPDLLVRSLTLSGEISLSGRPTRLTGLLTNATTQPGLQGEPMRLELTTGGAAPMRLRATIDRTGKQPRDEVLLVCDGMITPARRLGGDRLALDVSPCTSTFTLSLLLEGDRLSGDAQLVQRGFSATPSPKEGDARLAAGLQASLAEHLTGLPSIATRVELAGALEAPEAKLWSNLGPAVAAALESSAREALARHADDALDHAGRQVEARLGELNRRLTAADSGLAPLLESVGQELQELAAGPAIGGRLRQLGRMPGAGLLK